MEPTFIETEGRGIDMSLGPGWPGFNETLADSVSTMPYRGEETTALSAYWIDLLIERLENWHEAPGVEQALIHGNATELVKVDDKVIARSLYDLFDDERMHGPELLRLLHRWRELVLLRGGDFFIPGTYRRAPCAMGPGPDRPGA